MKHLFREVQDVGLTLYRHERHQRARIYQQTHDFAMLDTCCKMWHFFHFLFIVIFIIINALSQLYWGRLHEFHLSIMIYLEPNPLSGYTSSDLLLLLPSTSSSDYPFLLEGNQPAQKSFSLPTLFLACVGHIFSSYHKLDKSKVIHAIVFFIFARGY